MCSSDLGYLYTCGGTSLRTDIATPYVTSNDLSIYSLKNPLEPELLINCKFDLDFWNEIKYVHDVYVENDIAYCHAGTDGFFIVDFSDTANVQLIGSLTQYPQQGYNHSGWLHQDGTIYAMADETWGTDIKILDVSDLNNIEVIDTIGSNINDSLSMVHNLIFREDYLFVSHFFDGLYIFDLTDPYDIKIAGYYDTSTEPHADRKWQGAWGVYPFLSSGKVLISDMENGFWLFDASNAIVLSESSSPEQSINITIFPNPTSETLFINGLEQGDSNYIISSIKGDIIESGKLYRPYLKLPKNLISGIYFLQIENGDKQFQISFIKED